MAEREAERVHQDEERALTREDVLRKRQAFLEGYLREGYENFDFWPLAPDSEIALDLSGEL